MPSLQFRTTHGKTFHRCGIAFGKQPVVVDDKKLDKLFGSPRPSRNKSKQQTVHDVLKAESMLICEDVKPDKAEKSKGSDGK